MFVVEVFNVLLVMVFEVFFAGQSLTDRRRVVSAMAEAEKLEDEGVAEQLEQRHPEQCFNHCSRWLDVLVASPVLSHLRGEERGEEEEEAEGVEEEIVVEVAAQLLFMMSLYSLLTVVFSRPSRQLEATPVSVCVTAEYWNDFTGGVLWQAPGEEVLAESQDASGFGALTFASVRSSLCRWRQFSLRW